MEIIEKINRLSNEEIIWVFREFSKKIMLELDIKQENVLKDYLKSLESDKLIADLVSREPHKLDTKKLGEEYSSQVVKQLLISIAEDEGLSKKLNDFLENEKKETMWGTPEILSIGFVIVSAIIAISVQYKKGELTYGSGNISDNAVKIVQAIMKNMAKIIKG